MIPVCVIILAGGRSTRMGTDKAQVRVEGIRLIDAMLSSLSSLSSLPTTPIVVSPFDLGLPPEIPTVCEDPPFGGPVAGIAAGVALAHADLVAVVAVDAPHSPEALPALVEALQNAPDAAAAVAVDEEGFMQPLCAVWRKQALLKALEHTGTRDVPAKALYKVAGSVVKHETQSAERDYDTPEELAQLGRVEL
ncbi:molybdenum cofactor guanylyltransferase [Corynebacterium riegelii]|uniref:molybdenum cofactor guanylyltransferase n=1 Tax=Corynebacterium riegelii TaxID=156976 RepID=UPI0028892896|nr:NTP transferase domain-containing protein [Corynebacterium riegelii]